MFAYVVFVDESEQKSTMKKILFYDIHSTGHHLEYIQHLTAHCPSDVVAFFAVSENISKRVAPVSRVKFLKLPFSESETNRKRELAWILDRAVALEIDTVFFLNIDPYLNFLQIFKSNEFSVDGIWFHPTHRIPWLSCFDFRTIIKNVGKKLRASSQLMKLNNLRNQVNLYILDDKEGVDYLNRNNRISFHYLPDPISIEKVEYTQNEQSSNSKKSILLFGSIIPRKNLERLIEVVRREKFAEWTFDIIGKGKDRYVDQLKEISEGVDNVRIENRFVPNREMESLFSRSTIVLLVYRNFFGSSGVLGRAAKYNKPVITNHLGLIGHLVRKYKLGSVVNADYKGLAKALDEAIYVAKNSSVDKYLSDKTPNTFSKVIYRQNGANEYR